LAAQAQPGQAQPAKAQATMRGHYLVVLSRQQQRRVIFRAGFSTSSHRISRRGDPGAEE
jgi:hypothetical protein